MVMLVSVAKGKGGVERGRRGRRAGEEREERGRGEYHEITWFCQFHSLHIYISSNRTYYSTLPFPLAPHLTSPHLTSLFKILWKAIVQMNTRLLLEMSKGYER